MSKQYKDRTCVYCARQGIANTADHVVCRSFFETQARNNLPKVPACEQCNRVKAALEHHLTTVMPFGARHAGAAFTLARMVPPRLARNERLHGALSRALGTSFTSSNGGPWQFQGSLPLDAQCLSKLFGFIVRGLAFHHWGLIFGDDYFVHAGFLNGVGQNEFELLLGANASDRIAKDLGNGVFVYEGAQSVTDPKFTVWRMALYGAEVDGDRESCDERKKHAYGITAPKSWPAAVRLMAQLDSPSAGPWG